MQRAPWIALVLLATVAPARAEIEPALREATRPVAGVVVDAHTGVPVAGASVSAGSETTTSDADGRFAFPALSGAGEVFVMAVGYLPMTVRIADDGRLRVALSTELAEAGEVIEITGTAPDPVRTTTYRLDADQIRSLPGANNDALRAVQVLPGVTRMSYGIGGLILRGARTADSQVFVDGIEAPLAFHFGGVASIYPSTLLADLTVTPSGGDVARGGGVGGVVELATRPGRPDRWRAGGEIGFLDGGATADGPLPGGGAVAVGLRRSYAGDIAAAVAPSELAFLPRYVDGQLRLDQPLGAGQLTALAFFATDRVTRGALVDVEQRFVRTGLRYTRRLGDVDLSALGWSGWRDFAIDIELVDDGTDVMLQRRQGMVPMGARVDARRDTGWGHVAAGLDLEVTRYGATHDQDADGEPQSKPAHTMAQLGAWAEARWRIAAGKLNLKPGLRTDHLSSSERWVAEPRLTVSHELARWLTLREGLSVHHQPPAPINVVDHEGHRVPAAPARAVHASVGADLQLPAGVEVSVTTYQNQSAGPVMPSDEDLEIIQSLAGVGVVIENLVGNELGNSGGRGRSRGLELSVQHRSERWRVYASYTLARTEHYDGPAIGWQVTSLDQTHTANAVASVRLGVWRLGARARYATGLPRYPLRLDLDDDDVDVMRLRFGGRMRNFASLDLRVDRSWVRSWGALSVFLDVQNVTNRHNEEGLGTEKALPGLPVFPTFGVSLVPPA